VLEVTLAALHDDRLAQQPDLAVADLGRCGDRRHGIQRRALGIDRAHDRA
jgi:hypothetical protein